MEIVNLNKLDVVSKYVHRIAEACNPVNNMPAEEDVECARASGKELKSYCEWGRCRVSLGENICILI